MRKHLALSNNTSVNEIKQTVTLRSFLKGELVSSRCQLPAWLTMRHTWILYSVSCILSLTSFLFLSSCSKSTGGLWNREIAMWQCIVGRWTPVHMAVVSPQESQSHFQSKCFSSILWVWVHFSTCSKVFTCQIKLFNSQTICFLKSHSYKNVFFSFFPQTWMEPQCPPK